MDHETVIGLEVHVQLNTAAKLFCSCRAAFGREPNTLVCPVCSGQPGVLPVLNAQALRHAVTAGLALDAAVAPVTRFDRKNYFYPDLPKGYQISQLSHPINGPGALPLRLSSGAVVGIARAHLEEDAGKSRHDADEAGTLVDLNRCGVPLLEIVTEPVIDSPQMAFDYLTELKLTMRHIGVSDCDMEKGSLRCDVNISLKPNGRESFGTKIEIKNLNSFKMAKRALEYEIERQAAIYDADETIPHEETRLWDDERGETRVMRTKENSADYRYHPDPDLVPFRIPTSVVEEIRAALPELPGAMQERFQSEHGLSAYDAGVLVQDVAIARFFEETTTACNDAKAAANWITGELFAALKDGDHDLSDLAWGATELAELINMTKDGSLNVASARELFQSAAFSGGSPRTLAEERGLLQLNDEAALRELVQGLLDANPETVADIRGGKKKAAGAIVGQVMKETKGRANPGLVNRLIVELIGD